MCGNPILGDAKYRISKKKPSKNANLMLHAYKINFSINDIKYNFTADPPEYFKKFIDSQKAKESLKKNTEELIKRGGFGSPTFFYNDHMFFGNDRLSLFEESLQRGLLD